MIVTVKNEVNEPEVRLRAHRNKGLREPSRQYKRQDKNRFFFKPEIWAIYQHASIRFAFRRAFHGDGSPVRFFISTTEQGVTRAFRCTRAAQDSLRLNRRSRARIDPFAVKFARRMGTQTDTLQWRHVYCSLYIYYEHRIARATLERARARASSHERAAELGTFVSFFFLSFVYQVKT